MERLRQEQKSGITIRPIREEEVYLLEYFLSESIYQPSGAVPGVIDIQNLPRLRAYIEDFGKRSGDHCWIAEWKGKIVGAVWVRIIAGEEKGYGNIDSRTPEFAISVAGKYRNKGIGTLLMKHMIYELRKGGYRQASLSVHKENRAVKMYEDLGFRIIRENEEDYVMLLKLRGED